MSDPAEILEELYLMVQSGFDEKSPVISKSTEDIVKIVTNITNRACVRLLMSCLLAKVHNPAIDIRKPYTEIGGLDSYSGRTYDEKYINIFIHSKNLPCNSTTGFLTPALRNINYPLTRDVEIIGRPKEIYRATIDLLNLVQENEEDAGLLLAETIRQLLLYKREKDERLKSLLKDLESSKDSVPLSSEDIICLIEQHLKSPRSSRLPVLVVAAAYNSCSDVLKERILPIASHNAADKQTRNLGDVEITLINDNEVITSYEMRTKKVTITDVEDALEKIKYSDKIVDNYIFITTDSIEEDVREFCREMYEKTGGIEFVILDCIGFLRHFLHLFHRIRMEYLDAYQDLLLNEPDSAVSQPLKEVFLTLRQAAEFDKNNQPYRSN